VTVVRHLLTDDGGQPATGYVTATLVGAGLRPATQSQVVVAGDVRVGGDGQWVRDLVPTAVGEFYRVTLQPDGGRVRTLDVQVPVSASALWLGDLLLTAPVPEGTQLAGYLQGASAYQLAVANGFAGSQAQWLASLVGPTGPSAGYVHTQPSAAATWSITHGRGRLPDVAIYVGGVLVEADVAATTTTASISFPAPTAGYAVLT